MPRNTISRNLLKLAKLYGVQTWHFDGFGKRHRPGEETLLAVLNALGAKIENASQAGELIHHRQNELVRRNVEPVQVSWADRSPEFRFSIPPDTAPSLNVKLTLSGENGYRAELSSKLRTLKEQQREQAVPEPRNQVKCQLPSDLPPGVYACVLEFGGESLESTLLRSPVSAAGLPTAGTGSRQCLFLPTYAIRTEYSWGMGDYSDLARLVDVARETGASAVATLPLLPVFEDDPSPYSPVSRLLWNELYIDPRAAPEFSDCKAATATVDNAKFKRQVAALERSEFVDYAEQFALRRPLLDALARYAVSSPRLRKRLERFTREHPRAAKYARFRAACEKLGRPWQSWPVDSDRKLRMCEHFDESSYNYHLNAQRLAFEQLGRFQTNGNGASPVLYLDMPLGVRSDGFDTWLKPELFAKGMSAGAPPDAFFTSGQNWGFPPMKPESPRHDGHRYMQDSLRHIGEHAGIVRIDHVMSLHRLYWIPDGMSASEGAYVKYPAEEMYALLTLESNRTGTAIVGEDLGTVPRYVGPEMRKRRLFRMYATYFNIRPSERRKLVRPGREMFAYVDTHDMATFAAFIDGDDIGDRRKLGLLTARQARSELGARRKAVSYLRKQLENERYLDSSDSEPEHLLQALLNWLQDSDAAMVVMNLEDLWLEKRPQNTPGTNTERRNWQGRARLQLSEVLDTMRDHCLTRNRPSKPKPG